MASCKHLPVRAGADGDAPGARGLVGQHGAVAALYCRHSHVHCQDKWVPATAATRFDLQLSWAIVSIQPSIDHGSTAILSCLTMSDTMQQPGRIGSSGTAHLPEADSRCPCMMPQAAMTSAGGACGKSYSSPTPILSAKPSWGLPRAPPTRMTLTRWSQTTCGSCGRRASRCGPATTPSGSRTQQSRRARPSGVHHWPLGLNRVW